MRTRYLIRKLTRLLHELEQRADNGDQAAIAWLRDTDPAARYGLEPR